MGLLHHVVGAAGTMSSEYLIVIEFRPDQG